MIAHGGFSFSWLILNGAESDQRDADGDVGRGDESAGGAQQVLPRRRNDGQRIRQQGQRMAGPAGNRALFPPTGFHRLSREK